MIANVTLTKRFKGNLRGIVKGHFESWLDFKDGCCLGRGNNVIARLSTDIARCCRRCHKCQNFVKFELMAPFQSAFHGCQCTIYKYCCRFKT